MRISFSIFLLFFAFSLSFCQKSTPKQQQKTPPSKPLKITSLETATPVFIGYTEKAVYQKKSGTNKVVFIASFDDYETAFGGPTTGFYLWESVKLFFQNGGKNCFIVSVATTADPVQKESFERGLKISQEAAAQILVAPDAVKLPENDFYDFQRKMIDLSEALGDRFAILNTLSPSPNAEQDFQDFRNQTTGSNLSYSAVYYPWLTTQDGTNVPPSGALAGVFAQVDHRTGVWKAPANVQLNGIRALTKNLTSKEQENANVSATDGISVNVIREFTGRGILVWGARTLDGNSNDWRYIPLRRLMIMLENSIKKGLEWAVFEPNDANLWKEVESMVNAYLTGLWREGAIQGAKPENSFFAKCGLGKTMTQQDVLDGKLILEIGIAPVRPAEFIIIQLEFEMKQ